MFFSNLLMINNHSTSTKLDNINIIGVNDVPTIKLNETLANNYTLSNQEEPSITGLTDDTFVIAWQSDGQDGDGYGIYATIINTTTGHNITNEFLVNTNITRDQKRPTVMNLSNNRFIIVWDSNVSDGGEGFDIFAKIFDASTGQNLTNDFSINYNTTNHQQFSSICSFPDNTFVMAWTSNGQDGDGDGIFASVFNGTNGNNITSEFQVNKYITNSQWLPSISSLSLNTFVITWTGEGLGDGFGIFASVFDKNGVNLTNEFLVNNHTSDIQLFSSSCRLSDDTFSIAWQSYDQDGDGYGVFGSVNNATNGANITSEFQVNNYTTDSQITPTISGFTDKAFITTWISSGQDGDSSGVFAAIFNATSGKNLTDEFQVNENITDHQHYQTICTLSNYTYVIAWQSDGQDGDGGGIYFTILQYYEFSNETNGGSPYSPPTLPIPGFELGLLIISIGLISTFFFIRKHGKKSNISRKSS